MKVYLCNKIYAEEGTLSSLHISRENAEKVAKGFVTLYKDVTYKAEVKEFEIEGIVNLTSLSSFQGNTIDYSWNEEKKMFAYCF